jgi:hypothetical protein
LAHEDITRGESGESAPGAPAVPALTYSYGGTVVK